MEGPRPILPDKCSPRRYRRTYGGQTADEMDAGVERLPTGQGPLRSAIGGRPAIDRRARRSRSERCAASRVRPQPRGSFGQRRGLAEFRPEPSAQPPCVMYCSSWPRSTSSCLMRPATTSPIVTMPISFRRRARPAYAGSAFPVIVAPMASTESSTTAAAAPLLSSASATFAVEHRVAVARAAAGRCHARR